MQSGKLKGAKRETTGSAEARRLRRDGRIPAVIYGGEGGPEQIALEEREFSAVLDSGERVLDLDVDGSKEKVLLKDLQYGHLGDRVIHVDFQRVVRGERMTVNVPLKLTGTPAGVEKDGGMLTVMRDTLEIECEAVNMPKEIEHDVSELGIGDGVHVKDLTLPKGVTTEVDPDDMVCGVSEPEEEAEAEAPEEGAAQPEVIGESKAEGDKEDSESKD